MFYSVPTNHNCLMYIVKVSHDHVLLIQICNNLMCTCGIMWLTILSYLMIRTLTQKQIKRLRVHDSVGDGSGWKWECIPISEHQQESQVWGKKGHRSRVSAPVAPRVVSQKLYFRWEQWGFQQVMLTSLWVGTIERSTRLGGQGRPHVEGGVQQRGLKKTPWKHHERWEEVGDKWATSSRAAKPQWSWAVKHAQGCVVPVIQTCHS
jgi:hypothetical protein